MKTNLHRCAVRCSRQEFQLIESINDRIWQRSVQALTALLLSWSTAPVQAAEPADLVLRGGDVYTVNITRSWAEAVAIRDGKIVLVGNDDETDVLIGPETRVIELDGRMVLPGFHDSHIHPIGAMLKTRMCDLTGLPGSIELIF